MTAKRSGQLSRRDALKLLGAAAGASVLANLPSKWSTPALTAGVLPAHAQTSAVGCPDLDFTATISWEDSVDIDSFLLVPVPGSFLVGPKTFAPALGPQGTVEPFTGAYHGGDNLGVEGGSEVITVPMGNLINGDYLYSLYMRTEHDPVSVHVVWTGPCPMDEMWTLYYNDGLLTSSDFRIVGCQPVCPPPPPVP